LLDKSPDKAVLQVTEFSEVQKDVKTRLYGGRKLIFSDEQPITLSIGPGQAIPLGGRQGVVKKHSCLLSLTFQGSDRVTKKLLAGLTVARPCLSF